MWAGGTQWQIDGLLSGAICESDVDLNLTFSNQKCAKGFQWSRGVYENVVRRFRSLDYIRNNFCMGLPGPGFRP